MKPNKNSVPGFFRQLLSKLREWRRHRRIMQMCNESRRRMNGYTHEQRQELYRQGLDLINSGSVPQKKDI